MSFISLILVVVLALWVSAVVTGRPFGELVGLIFAEIKKGWGKVVALWKKHQ